MKIANVIVVRALIILTLHQLASGTELPAGLHDLAQSALHVIDFTVRDATVDSDERTNPPKERFSRFEERLKELASFVETLNEEGKARVASSEGEEIDAKM